VGAAAGDLPEDKVPLFQDLVLFWRVMVQGVDSASSKVAAQASLACAEILSPPSPALLSCAEIRWSGCLHRTLSHLLKSHCSVAAAFAEDPRAYSEATEGKHPSLHLCWCCLLEVDCS